MLPKAPANVAKFPSVFDLVFIVFILLLGLFFLLYKKILARDTLEFNYDNPPNRILSLVAKFVWKVFTSSQGNLALALNDLYKLKVTAYNCRINVESLQDYQKICGIKVSQTVPLCFPEILFTKLLVRLVLSSKFRLSPLGLIHRQQEIESYGSLKTKQPYTLSAEVSEYRNTERGVEVDITMDLIDGEDCLWTSKMTLLSRKNYTKKSAKSLSRQPSQDVEVSSAEVKVAKNVGLEYARISGDWSPHHLYGWTAKLLGFKAAIAHGMWTLSIALNHLEINGLMSIDYPRKLSAAFKTPLYLPSDVTLRMGYLRNRAAGSWFRVEDKNLAPHLVGKYCLIERNVDSDGIK